MLSVSTDSSDTKQALLRLYSEHCAPRGAAVTTYADRRMVVCAGEGVSGACETLDES